MPEILTIIITIIITAVFTLILDAFVGNPLKKMLDNKSSIKSKSNYQRKTLEDVYKKMPELIDEIWEDHCKKPIFREFVILHKGATYNGYIHYYCYENHENLSDKIKYLEHNELIIDAAFNDVPRYDLTEEFVDMLERYYIDVSQKR